MLSEVDLLILLKLIDKSLALSLAKETTYKCQKMLLLKSDC